MCMDLGTILQITKIKNYPSENCWLLFNTKLIFSAQQDPGISKFMCLKIKSPIMMIFQALSVVRMRFL